MKNKLKKIGATSVVVISLISSSVFAGTGDYGAAGAADEEAYTLEAMLEYALEDEYLAHAEYELIINELGAARPFTNIIKAEETHIKLVEALYSDYDLALPSVDPSTYIALPESIEAALATGVEAEIANIAMYEIFLSQELPDDVREAFEYLQKASESHLAAFEGNNSGNGNQAGGNQGTNARGNQNARGNGNGNIGTSKGNQGTNPNNQGMRQYQNENEDCILED